MKFYLAKTDPSEYSIDDFAKDTQISWAVSIMPKH